MRRAGVAAAALVLAGWTAAGAVACTSTGETSASLIDTSAQDFGCLNTAGNTNIAYRRLFPLHGPSTRSART